MRMKYWVKKEGGRMEVWREEWKQGWTERNGQGGQRASGGRGKGVMRVKIEIEIWLERGRERRERKTEPESKRSKSVWEGERSKE